MGWVGKDKEGKKLKSGLNLFGPGFFLIRGATTVSLSFYPAGSRLPRGKMLGSKHLLAQRPCRTPADLHASGA